MARNTQGQSDFSQEEAVVSAGEGQPSEESEMEPAQMSEGYDDEQDEELLDITVAGEDADTGEWDEGDADQVMEFLAIDAGAAVYEVMDVIDDFTDDAEILEDFEGRQNVGPGSMRLREQLEEHHSLNPDISGDDVDAAWEDANSAGEEAVGGTTPTPDQDIVEELGEALGITYRDDEELDTNEKLGARDRERWELNPDSVDTEYNEAVAPEDTEEKDEDEIDLDEEDGLD